MYYLNNIINYFSILLTKEYNNQNNHDNYKVKEVIIDIIDDYDFL